MTAWRKLREALESGVNQRFTRTGLLFSLTCVLVGLAAVSSANNLLFLTLAAMLATLMISGLISRLSLAGLALDLLLPEHICARRKLVGRIALQNEKRWMPSFSIHLAAHGQSGIAAPMYFPVIPGGARIEQSTEVHFDRRGSYRENSFRFSTRFPFGFAERRMNVLLRREVLVYPSIDPQPGFEDLLIALNGDIESFYRGQGSDFYRIRPYEALRAPGTWTGRLPHTRAISRFGSLRASRSNPSRSSWIWMWTRRTARGSIARWIAALIWLGTWRNAARACSSARRRRKSIWARKAASIPSSNILRLYRP